MDNPQSLAMIQTPEVPDDFNGGVGVEFARSLMKLLNSAQVVGTEGNANPFDILQMQKQVEDLSDEVDAKARKERVVIMNGVNNGELVVPFENIGTTEYTVTAEIIIPAGADPPNVNVFVIDANKEAAQCKVRIDGTGNPYKFRFTILENKVNS
jgi:hypothetical protein